MKRDEIMGYHFREVICPYCEHKFMWQKDTQERNSWSEYRNKKTGELCLSAKCPTCSNEMIISKNNIVGINIDNNNFITIPYKGI